MSVPYFNDPEGLAPLQDNDELLDDVLDDDPVLESEGEVDFWNHYFEDQTDEVDNYPWWGPDE